MSPPMPEELALGQVKAHRQALARQAIAEEWITPSMIRVLFRHVRTGQIDRAQSFVSYLLEHAEQDEYDHIAQIEVEIHQLRRAGRPGQNA